MPKLQINQKLIAQQLHLSTTTVSKSFRNHPDIKPKTRALVLEYAAKLGYVASQSPRSGERAGKNRRAKFLGVLFNSNVSESADIAGAGYLTGLSEAAGLANASLIVHRFTGSSDRVLNPAFQPAAMRDGLLDGLVLIHRFEADVVRQLAEQYPCVALTHFVHGVRMDLVDSNHANAMATMSDHLYALGHRKIGFLGRQQELSYNQARFGSYVQSLSRLGLAFDPALTTNVFSNGIDFDAQAELVIEQRKRGVHAWMCVADYDGYEVMRRIGARGLSVPEDVSITGFDAVVPMFGLPQITTVRVPFEEMGVRAVGRLQHRIGRPSQPGTQTHIDCQFVEGQTTGPAPKSE